ncbi:MAG: prolipoprotein diacylglyceryl transferase [Clostridia bacterium]|jgi:phosphatidylglycerol:prolipoprotein diacylglycerol transferase
MVDPVALSVFGRPIYWYGIIIAAAVLIGIFLAMRYAPKRGYESDLILDFCLWAIPLAIVGARVYYVVFEWENYMRDWRKVIAIWEGGLAIYGALIGGVVAALLFSKFKKVNFWDLADIVSPSLILGQAMGRWGNFFNQEAYGYEITNKMWQWFPAAVFIEMDQKWHMATFFYESMWNLIVFFYLLFYRRRTIMKGNVFFMYLLLYGIGRIVIEGLRTDSLMWGPFRVSQLLSGIFILVSSWYLYRRYKLKGVDE